METITNANCMPELHDVIRSEITLFNCSLLPISGVNQTVQVQPEAPGVSPLGEDKSAMRLRAPEKKAAPEAQNEPVPKLTRAPIVDLCVRFLANVLHIPLKFWGDFYNRASTWEAFPMWRRSILRRGNRRDVKEWRKLTSGRAHKESRYISRIEGKIRDTGSTFLEKRCISRQFRFASECIRQSCARHGRNG